MPLTNLSLSTLEKEVHFICESATARFNAPFLKNLSQQKIKKLFIHEAKIEEIILLSKHLKNCMIHSFYISLPKADYNAQEFYNISFIFENIIKNNLIENLTFENIFCDIFINTIHCMLIKNKTISTLEFINPINSNDPALGISVQSITELKKVFSLNPKIKLFIKNIPYFLKHYNDYEIVKNLNLKLLENGSNSFTQLSNQLSSYPVENIIKYFGHVLGVTGNIPLTTDKIKEPIKIMGNNNIESTFFLTHLLKQYIHKYELYQSYWVEIFNAIFCCYMRAIDELLKNITFIQMRNYCYDEPFIKLTGWPGHTFAFILYKEYLVIDNQGEGFEFDGSIQIWRLDKNKSINESYLRSTDTIKSKEIAGLMNNIKSIIDPLYDVVLLPAQIQKYPNCSLKNTKTGLKGLLYIFFAERCNISPSTFVSEIFKLSNLEYKHFTNFIRNQTCELAVFQLYTREGYEKKAIFDFLYYYLEQHQDTNSNKPEDEHLTRIEYILNSLKNVSYHLSDEFQTYFLDKIKHYSDSASTPANNTFLPLFNKQGTNPKSEIVQKKVPQSFNDYNYILNTL